MDNGKLFSGFWSRSVAVRMERRELPWKVGCRQLIVWAGGGCKGECREESQIHRGLRHKCFTAGAIRSLCLLHCDIALLPRNDHRWPQIMMIFIFVYINITLFYGNIYSVCIIIYIIMLQILHISNLFAFIIVMWSPGLVRSIHSSILWANLYWVPTVFQDLVLILSGWPSPHTGSVLKIDWRSVLNSRVKK